jgi:hypothetical protein
VKNEWSYNFTSCTLAITFPLLSDVLYWIIGRKSQLSPENKLLVYKVILKPVRTYGVQLWGTASNSNLEILERFQSKVLRIITDAPWYVPNTVTKHDLQIPTVKQEARKYTVSEKDCTFFLFFFLGAQCVESGVSCTDCY